MGRHSEFLFNDDLDIRHPDEFLNKESSVRKSGKVMTSKEIINQLFQKGSAMIDSSNNSKNQKGGYSK